jgi:hypothetical protein
MIRSFFKAIGYVGLCTLSIYALVIDDRQLSGYGFIAWLIVFYYWWRKDREKAKALEEEKLRALQDRVAYLERERQPHNHQPWGRA